MLQYEGVTANSVCTVTEDGKVRVGCEVIILVTEPQYAPGVRGVTKSHSMSTLRFSAGVDGLRQLSKTLSEMADEAEGQEKRINGRTEPST